MQILRELIFYAAALFAGCALAAPQVQQPAPSQRASAAEGSGHQATRQAQKKPGRHAHRRQVGKASIYADKFAGRKMANGRRMDPRRDNAASKTLPLGTRALVRNLETGQSAVVTIEDRGPFVAGRVVDLSPASAEQIGLSKEEGLARVEVVPLYVPPPGATVAEN